MLHQSVSILANIHFLDLKSKNSLVGEQGSYPNPDNSQCIMFQNLKNIHVF